MKPTSAMFLANALFLLGVGLVAIGCWMIYPPAGAIAAGVGCMVCGFGLFRSIAVAAGKRGNS